MNVLLLKALGVPVDATSYHFKNANLLRTPMVSLRIIIQNNRR